MTIWTLQTQTCRGRRFCLRAQQQTHSQPARHASPASIQQLTFICDQFEALRLPPSPSFSKFHLFPAGRAEIRRSERPARDRNPEWNHRLSVCLIKQLNFLPVSASDPFTSRFPARKTEEYCWVDPFPPILLPRPSLWSCKWIDDFNIRIGYIPLRHLMACFIKKVGTYLPVTSDKSQRLNKGGLNPNRCFSFLFPN